MFKFVYKELITDDRIPSWLKDSWVVDFRHLLPKRKRAKRIPRVPHKRVPRKHIIVRMFSLKGIPHNPWKNTKFIRFTLPAP